MKPKTALLASSMSEMASLRPAEKLGPRSRYVVLADLRMGDGGSKDELFSAKKALHAILGRWYLEKGYVLVLNGDVEDLRRFWLKDIMGAWPELYAVFDAFADSGRLRKIVGERDLSLLRIASYPYALSQALTLEFEARTLLVMHGHQAAAPCFGRDYLSDYIVRWLGSSKRPRLVDSDDDRLERFKAELRLYRATSHLGIATIQGHTHRPLFESLSNRDAVRAEVERLLREGDPRGEGSVIDRMIGLYRKSAKGAERGSRSPGRLFEERGIVSPCLFSPGRALGAQGIRMLEIEDGAIRLARWTREKKGSRIPRGEGEVPGQAEGVGPYLRRELRSARISALFERIDLLGPREFEGTMEDKA